MTDSFDSDQQSKWPQGTARLADKIWIQFVKAPGKRRCPQCCRHGFLKLCKKSFQQQPVYQRLTNGVSRTVLNKAKAFLIRKKNRNSSLFFQDLGISTSNARLGTGTSYACQTIFFLKANVPHIEFSNPLASALNLKLRRTPLKVIPQYCIAHPCCARLSRN